MNRHAPLHLSVVDRIQCDVAARASEQRPGSPEEAVAAPVSRWTCCVAVLASPGLFDTARRIAVTEGRKALWIDQQMFIFFILMASQNSSLFNNQDISIM